MIGTVLQVAAGGAIGASGRYLTSVAATKMIGHGYPWGTMIVNVVGSFVMGVLVVYLMSKDGGTRYAPLLMTGVLGGFTTFSAFSLDALTIFERGEAMPALFYVLATVALSILAIFIGLSVARGIWA